MHRLFCNGDAFDMGNTNGKFGDNSTLISFLRHFYKPNSSSWIFLLGSYNLTDWASSLKWFYDEGSNVSLEAMAGTLDLFFCIDDPHSWKLKGNTRSKEG